MQSRRAGGGLQLEILNVIEAVVAVFTSLQVKNLPTFSSEIVAKYRKSGDITLSLSDHFACLFILAKLAFYQNGPRLCYKKYRNENKHSVY